MSLFHTILHVAKVIRSLQYIFFVNGIKISLKYTAFPCVPPFIFEAEAPLFAVSLALTVAVYSVPCLGANAVFIWLPAVKHVAKAKTPPGGVAERDKRGATVQKDSQEDRVLSCRHLVPLLYSSVTHFTGLHVRTVKDVSYLTSPNSAS